MSNSHECPPVECGEHEMCTRAVLAELKVERFKAALNALKEALTKAKERNPQDDEDHGYNNGLDEAIRIVSELNK